MIDWTMEYIISQVLVLMVYACLIATYFQKKRMNILNTNVIAHFLQIVSFILLHGLTGVFMNIFYIIRDSFLAIDYKNERKRSRKEDILIIIIFLIIILVLSIISYNGWQSLLSILATIISTIAIWQKSPKIYKALGIPTSLCWLGYNIFLKSVFAIILESILLISTITGYLIERKRK